MKRTIVLTLCSIAFLVLVAAYLYFKLQTWSGASIELKEPEIVEFPRGTSLKVLSGTLAQQKLVSHPQLFELWVKYFSDYSRFQAGRYRFESEVSPRQIAELLMSGETYNPVVLEFTIPEGFTLRAIVDRLVGLGVGTREEFDTLLADERFRKELGVNASSLEGYLYPATYSFIEFPTPNDAISKPVETFWKRLPDNYQQQVEKMGITLQDAVTIASLIELETPHPEEMANVSEVIWRRLKANMALAIDAALIYGIEDYRGNISREHLKDSKNPYNTRIHPGLPPTPIGSPSRAALEAVLEPSDEGYYYYVLDLSRGSRHRFSKTLKEHNTYVRELVREQRRRRQEARKQ